jgi:biotin---protein ligase
MFEPFSPSEHASHTSLLPGDETVATNRPEYLTSLRQILFPKYAVAPITSDALLNEPWTESCALLVVSGHDYLELCRRMGPRGTARMQDFVQSGGRFLGINAGACYGSERRTEIHPSGEEGNDCAEHNLGFFPAECRGSLNRQVASKTSVAIMIGTEDGRSFAVYGKVGGAFSDLDSSAPDGFAMIARFALGDQTEHDSSRRAAVVYCPVGQGACVLASPHIE